MACSVPLQDQMFGRCPRFPTAIIPTPASTSAAPNMSHPLPAPVDGVDVVIAWTPPVGVGVAPPTPPVGVGVAPPTPPVGDGVGVNVGVGVGVASQPRTRMKPDPRVARSRLA